MENGTIQSVENVDDLSSLFLDASLKTTVEDIVLERLRTKREQCSAKNHELVKQS